MPNPPAGYPRWFVEAFFGAFMMTHPYSRRTFLASTFVAGTALATHFQPSHAMGGRSSESGAPPKPTFPVADYHVHLSNTLTIDQALQLTKDRGVQLGILEHPHVPGERHADERREIQPKPFHLRSGADPAASPAA